MKRFKSGNRFLPYITGAALSLCFALSGQGQTGTVNAPVAYVGSDSLDPDTHEGGLRYAVGVENIQTLRANRAHPDSAEGFGWTYNHGSNLCYWNHRFYQHYLSNPVDEHIAPGQTLVTTSGDGRHWSKPEVVFPPYKAPPGVTIPAGYHGYMMHQRMGFYVAPNGRLLVLGFYGHTEDPFGPGGIGRVVREAYTDGRYGPIYFIRYSSFNKWNESNTSYPFYKTSADSGFLNACRSLLNNKLMTFQWYEEDGGRDGFYGTKKGAEAFCWYHRKDGIITGLWKKSLGGLSVDNGQTFSRPAKDPGFIMSGGKQWGQRTADGRYAICYNPVNSSEYRYPLAIVTGDDGISYDHLLLVQGEVPPRRFSGRWKDFGPCYMRGIEEGNGAPPGSEMWLSYSMNKEDIWIARIPTPVTWKVSGPVRDDFDTLHAGSPVPKWNIYSPHWAPVILAASPDRSGLALKLTDTDPYDYARAIRVFSEDSVVKAEFEIYADPENNGVLEIELSDRFGHRPVMIRFDSSGRISVPDGTVSAGQGSSAPVPVETVIYAKARWIKVKLEASAVSGTWSVAIDGKLLSQTIAFAVPVKSLERLSFRTGPYRSTPTRTTPNETNDPPLAGCDEPAPATLFFIDNVTVTTNRIR